MSSTVLGGIEVAAGSLILAGPVVGTGADNIVGAATLEFDAVVRAGQTVDFSGAGGTLDLANLRGFHAGIAGFDTVGSNDALLIGGGWAFDGATTYVDLRDAEFRQRRLGGKPYACGQLPGRKLPRGKYRRRGGESAVRVRVGLERRRSRRRRRFAVAKHGGLEAAAPNCQLSVQSLMALSIAWLNPLSE